MARIYLSGPRPTCDIIWVNFLSSFEALGTDVIQHFPFFSFTDIKSTNAIIGNSSRNRRPGASSGKAIASILWQKLPGARYCCCVKRLLKSAWVRAALACLGRVTGGSLGRQGLSFAKLLLRGLILERLPPDETASSQALVSWEKKYE